MRNRFKFKFKYRNAGLPLALLCFIVLHGCKSEKNSMRSPGQVTQNATDAGPEKTQPYPGDVNNTETQPSTLSKAEVRPELNLAPKKGLYWKRVDYLVQDLKIGLKLKDEDLCAEESGDLCGANIFAYTLGGHSAHEKGQYKGADFPAITTSLALDRLVLGACTKRVDLDFEQIDTSRAPSVFKIVSTEKVTEKQRVNIVDTLYKNLLQREPLESEIALYTPDTFASTREFLIASCFAVGTSSEFIFY